MSRAAQPTLFDNVAGAKITAERLISLASALGAASAPDLSHVERRLVRKAVPVDDAQVEALSRAIRSGGDPLGEYFCELRRPEERRGQGATYTPLKIVDWMISRAAAWIGEPSRVIDPGVGSGRFLSRAARAFPHAHLIGIEIDPLASLLARANLAALGFANRSRIVVADYRDADLGPAEGRTLYIGNPPYVRHHQIDPAWKAWLSLQARKLGLEASQLAGLHVHFFMATAQRTAPGDCGIFITAAEWLDVNYGKLVRDLFLGPLGGMRIDVIEPSANPFPDAAATAAITFFEAGTRPERITLRRIGALEDLSDTTNGRAIRRERLESQIRWTHLTRPRKRGPAGYVELGELCRVHRGQVTGANKFWIAGDHSCGLPETVFFPTVTKARELIRAGKILETAAGLRMVIDLPPDLDVFDRGELAAVERFLSRARTLGIHEGYIASNRRAWWSVGLRHPAPILATYMARRPPAFVQNRVAARHINIAHGLYPRENFGDMVLSNLVDYLSRSVQVSDGRTYAGGLTKFEPREVERLWVPPPELLRQGAIV
ncbi:MAG: N-6 DNA methylase [Planctomycetes bacterium]|nr:N-6 DNA methylase [Planctomycetota bacterium]